MKSIQLIFSATILSSSVFPAVPETDNNFPPAQCMSRCELGINCASLDVEEVPDLDSTALEFASNCHGNYLYAIEGMCSDGQRMLAAGTGFTSEIRLYTAGGTFEGLMTQSDAVSSPCLGQTFWPRYLRCESPIVVIKFCGFGFEVGSPAPEDRWYE